MKNLLYKELRLTLHPTNIIFLFLAAMVFIPGYPYYVACFFSTLGIQFLCVNARENGDAVFSMALPVRKGDVVRARIALCAGLEVLQLALMVPCFLIKDAVYPPEMTNPVGMEANFALLGLSLVLLGAFNAVFFPAYFKNIRKVGVPFVKGIIPLWLLMLVFEALTHFVPFFQALDTTGAAFLPEKLLVLAAGGAVFALLTLAACRSSVRRFEKLDL